MSWPVHSAENEPLRASRTYGWRRTRSTDSGGGARDRDRDRRRLPRSASDSTRSSPGDASAGAALPEDRAAARGRRVCCSPARRPVSDARPSAGRAAGVGRERGEPEPIGARGSPPRAPVGTRTTPANRKNPRPSVRNRSPIEATFWMNGIGIGMMSPSGPAWHRKSTRRGVGGTITWNGAVDIGRREARRRRGSAPRSACTRR